MSTTSTRRSLLKLATGAAAYGAGVTTLSVGAIVATATNTAKAATTATTAQVSPQLASMIAESHRLDAIVDLFYDSVFHPAVDKHTAEVAQHRARVAAVPPVTEYGGPSMAGPPVVFTSERPYTRAQAAAYVKGEEREHNSAEDWQDTIAAARRFIAADDRRNAVIAKLGTDPAFPQAISDREDELLAPMDRLDDAIYDFPAATVADLSAKLAHMTWRGFERDTLLSVVQADVARIVSREA